jgi:MFS family permease
MMAGALFVMVPLRLHELGSGAFAIAALLAAVAAAEALTSRRIGAAADRRGPTVLIRAGLVLTAGALCLLGLLSYSAPLVAFSGFLALLAMALLWPSASALLSQSADRANLEQGYAFSVINLAWAGGQALGAYGGVAFASQTSEPGAFYLGATLCMVTALTLHRRAPGIRSSSSESLSERAKDATCARSSDWIEHRLTKPEVRGSTPLGRLPR